MQGSIFRAPLVDDATESNTALLATSHLPEVLTKNRKLCRRHGVDDGPKRLRQLQHFVTQQVVNLLSKHGIKQRTGKPYAYSSPKGFLQHPNEWLAERGYYISGWPAGLPKGSISIWPTHLIFALAAMFINDTISLRPLSSTSKSVLREMSPSKRLASTGTDKSRTDKSTREIDVPSEAKEKEVSADSDLDAEGSSESETETGPSTEFIVAPFATENKRKCDEVSKVLPGYPAIASSDVRAITTAPPVTPPDQRTYACDTNFSNVVNAPSSIRFGPESNIDRKFGLTDPRSIGLLVSADLQVHLDTSRKHRINEDMPYLIPPSAGVNWVPPMSATRETKRARMV